MSTENTKWKKAPIDNTLVKEIAQRYHISILEASVLVRRNIVKGDDILFFLEKDFVYLHSPFLFKDMEIAIDRIHNAKDEQERVLVFGDKDVDGITSTAILVKALRDFGVDTSWRVPTGEDAYGLSKDVIDFAQSQEITLILTIDCGVVSLEEVDYANELGIDVIICDHHMPGPSLPDAVAVLDAKIPAQGYPFDGICAAGLAQKICVALAISRTPMYNSDIVLLNVVPLEKSWQISLLNIRNLVVQWKKQLTISQEDVIYQLQTLSDLLQGKQILVYNQKIQHQLLTQALGKVDIHSLDLQPLVDTHYSKLKNKSLLQISEYVKLPRYLSEEISEIDIFYQLYKSISYIEFPSIKEAFDQVADLVAIATVADIMPIRSENRFLVNAGIHKLSTAPHKNLLHLLKALHLQDSAEITSRTLGWKIAPIINSTGRMGQANIAVDMLLTENDADAQKAVGELLSLNEQRKKQMDSHKNNIRTDVEQSLAKHEKFAVVFHDSLPHTFTGIVAGQYSRKHNVPVIIIAKKQDHSYNASIRCPATFNAPEIIQQLKPYILHGGGHRGAAGFSFEAQHKDTLTKELFRLLAEQAENTVVISECKDVDVEIPETYFNPDDLVALHRKFEPYGEGWPVINVLISKVAILSVEVLGKGREHLKLIIQIGKFKVPSFVWQYKELGIDEDHFSRASSNDDTGASSSTTNTNNAQNSGQSFIQKISFVATIKINKHQGLENFSLILQEWIFEK